MPMETKTLYTHIRRGAVLAAALFLAACAGTNTSGPVPDGYYRIQQGDNLYRIGLRFNQSVGTLARWNNMTDPSQIEVGQVIKVRANAAGGSNAPRTGSSVGEVKPVNRVVMQWPVDNHTISVPYDGVNNKGVDFSGAQGAPVKAAADGKVLYAGDGVRGYGNLVLVSHSGGMLTAYAHNERLLVSKDQIVRAGQQIATMGSSESNAVGLHFEVRMNGKAVNPMTYLY